MQCNDYVNSSHSVEISVEHWQRKKKFQTWIRLNFIVLCSIMKIKVNFDRKIICSHGDICEKWTCEK